ncbi:WYL domain-containing protein [Saxibacter everestensis]|uniref:WYL domain-containing protein n=1 Tax=Saxibacter everestensis TaxID=2909229 RepID=A0ABY8QWR9_9MICO|nr:WYL domain-containing protein [Brevibacteriaceae bacterium ZFBP1038]
MSTSVRLLELLALLQNHRYWAGEDLAHRLEVSPRTLRRAVEQLRDHGYPVHTARGVGGGYQLVPGAVLPPLVLSEAEAAAVVLGLKEVASGVYPTSADAAVSAMAKIVQVLPMRIRRRIDSLRTVAMPRAERQQAGVADVAALTTVALACRDNEALRFAYRARDGLVSERVVHPHRTTSVDHRLYLIAWDLDRADWRTFRIDRIDNPIRSGKRFTPRQLPDSDPVEYVHEQIRSLPARYPIRATVQAPAERVKREVAQYGTVEPIDDGSCGVYIPADSLDWATFCLGAIGAPLVVHGPPEAIDYIHSWGQRLIAGTESRTS